MRTILLCHQPDPAALCSFDAHFDWLMELTPEPNPDSRTIATWRLGQRPDRFMAGQTLQAEAIAGHRAFYLDVRAPRQLSGGRGLVYPVARGSISRWEERDGRLLLDLGWTDGSMQRFEIAPDGRTRCLERSASRSDRKLPGQTPNI